MIFTLEASACWFNDFFFSFRTVQPKICNFRDHCWKLSKVFIFLTISSKSNTRLFINIECLCKWIEVFIWQFFCVTSRFHNATLQATNLFIPTNFEANFRHSTLMNAKLPYMLVKFFGCRRKYISISLLEKCLQC